MKSKVRTYTIYVIKALLTIAFLGAGAAKLAGAEPMIAVYETIGVGHWFRYLTGFIEVVCAILLLVPRAQAFGAIILVCTMTGAVLSHLFILGPSAIPAAALGVLSAIVAYAHRDQITQRFDT